MKKRMFEMFQEQTNYPVAKDYEKRAKAIVRHLLDMVQASVMAVGGKWKEPTPQMMDAFVDELGGILNWVMHGANKKGITGKTYSNLPLTEEQMTEVEAMFRGTKVGLVEDDVAKRKFCYFMRENSNEISIVTDKKEMLDIIVVED